MLAYAIYTKVTHPEKTFIDCIPFMDDFQQNSEKDLNAEADESAVQAETVKVIATETKVSEKPSADAVKTKPAKVKTNKAKKKSTKPKVNKPKAKPTKSKAKKIKGDNIKKINGIGPVFEKKLNSIGVDKFEHIAAWSDADAIRIDEQLELSGRPQREDWIAKAKIFAAEKNA